MKLLLLAAFAIGSAAAGDLYQHVQLPLLDCYVDSMVERLPDLPGLTGARYSVAISISTIDSSTSAFAVYLRVKMADGSSRVFRKILNRDGVNPSIAHLAMGDAAPQKIEALQVTRLHAEPIDQVIH